MTGCLAYDAEVLQAVWGGKQGWEGKPVIEGGEKFGKERGYKEDKKARGRLGALTATVAHAARALMASVCRVWTSIRSAGGSISVYAAVVFRCFPPV